MPHTNRKKKSSFGSTSNFPTKHTQPKLQNYEDDEGWTHVRRGPKVDHTHSSLPPAEYDNDLTVENLAAEHADLTSRWEASEDFATLLDTLAPYKKDNSITSVFCIALGSLSNFHSSLRRRSHIQLAALDAIVRALGMSSLF
jgi:hypothetical protein